MKAPPARPDRGTGLVETRAHSQHGKRVCVFRRRVLIPRGTPENLERFEAKFLKEDPSDG